MLARPSGGFRKGSRRRAKRGSSLVIGILALVGISIPIFAAPAAAHAFLVDTLPQPGSRLMESPARVTLLFSERIVSGSGRLDLETSDGMPISIGDPNVSKEGTRLDAELPRLERGVYVAKWRVTSAVDGHLEVGEFAFGIRTTGAEDVATQGSAEVSWSGIASSWLFLLGLLTAIGGVVSERWIWRQNSTDPLPIKAPVTIASTVTAIAALAQVLLVAATPGLSLQAAATSRIGYLAIVAATGAAVAAGFAVTRHRDWSLVFLLAAGVAAAYRGHPGTGQWWEAPVNALHVGLAGVWVGALAHLVMVLWRSRGDVRRFVVPAAHRYAALAAWTVPLLLVAGVATARGQTEISELTSTSYGRALLIKVGLVASALVAALAARRVLGDKQPRLTLLRHVTTLEMGILATVVIATAVLASTRPPRDVATVGTLLGPAPTSRSALKLAERAGYFSVYLTADAGLMRLEVLGFQSRPAPVDLDLSGRDPQGRDLELHPRSCGPGCFVMDLDWQDGLTELTASVSHPELRGGAVEFSVPWPRRSARPELLQTILSRIRAQRTIEVAETVTSVPGRAGRNETRVSGEFLASQELFAAGDATNLNLVPAPDAHRSVTLFIPGAATWYRLWLDERNFLQRELIINPGHRIERELRYTFETRRDRKANR